MRRSGDMDCCPRNRKGTWCQAQAETSDAYQQKGWDKLFPVVKYDEEHDVLHIHLAPYEYTEDEEVVPGVIIRLSAREPKRLIAITILDYLRRKGY